MSSVCDWSLFCNAELNVLSKLAIISLNAKRKGEMVALLLVIAIMCLSCDC